MKIIALSAAIALTLTACGGGGGTSASGATPVAATPLTQLASYIGNWTSACYDHAMDSAAISRTPGTNDSISIAFKTDYYVNANCTGNILGTYSESAGPTAVYAATVDASVVLAQGAAASSIKVDKINATKPAGAALVTGTGVVRTVTNGQVQWCIDFGGGRTTCINDQGAYAASSQTGGLYLQGNTLYELVVNGSAYLVNEVFTRQ